MSIPPADSFPAERERDDVDWVLAQQGVGEAFGRVFDRHRDRVKRHVMRLVPVPAAADDAVAITFLAAWRRRADARLVDGSLLPWLLTTSRYLCLNRRRAHARHNARTHLDGLAALPADPMSVEDRVRNRALREAIDDALAELSDEDYTVYLLCIEEGLTYQQASLTMGVSHGAVRNRLARLRAGLRIALGSTRDGR